MSSDTITVKSWAADNATAKEFSKHEFERKKKGENWVVFKLSYCGVCHSDLHTVVGDFGPQSFPMVPGHELAGLVTEIGPKVTKFKVGQKVGVGCMVDSCGDCDSCKKSQEQYCEKGMGLTYNSKQLNHGKVQVGDQETYTKGGYSNYMIVHEDFAISIPEEYPLEKAGVIMCAGITMYDPLVNWGANKNKNMVVGIVGLGGLGQMGVQLAAAMGNKVVVVSTTKSKEELAKKMGASDFVISNDPESVKAHARSIDLLLNTVSCSFDLQTYQPLMKTDGNHVLIGGNKESLSFNQFSLMFSRQSISGSIIGGIQNTQECINFCSEKKIYPETQLINCKEIQSVYEKLEGKNDQVIRYVIDSKTVDEL